MVDKIDRPDPLNKYEILPSKETHDEGQRKQQDQRRDDDEFSSPGHEISWSKYRVSTPNRRVITLQRTDVRQAIFRQAMLQNRTTILEMDLILNDSRTLPRAHLVSSNLNDYWRWKGWVPGQVVPLEMMVQGQFLEVSIQELSPSSRTVGESTGTGRVQANAPKKVWPWQDAKTRELNWLWVAKICGGIIVGLWIIGKAARWW